MGRDRQVCEKGELPIFFVKGWGIWCLLDTGSDSTILSTKIVKRVCGRQNLKECFCRMMTIAGERPLAGEVMLNCKKLTGVNTEVRVHVAQFQDNKFDAILGCDLLKRVDGWTRHAYGKWSIKLGKRKYSVRRTIDRDKHISVGCVSRLEPLEIGNKLRDKFKGIFYKEGEPLSATGRVRHTIILDDERPVYVKPRRYPHAMRGIIREQLDEMCKQGVIRKSRSPYCSPLWVVPKRVDQGEKPKYRVVVDFRELNKKTTLERYPLPRLEDMLDRMSGASVFSVLDLKSGYHQIEMHPRDIEKTAFSFERGHFEFLRMPFGLKNAPSTFQRLMDEFLEELQDDTVQIYMDDIIVFSKNQEEHRQHLEQLFKRIKDFDLKISAEKSTFFRTEVKFMGHIISAEGVRPDPGKVQAIVDIPIPETVKDIRTFLGMVGYYRKFLDKFADMTEPLTALLKKGAKVCISTEVARSVMKCKQALCSAPVLKFPNLKETFILTTDASQEAIGAVLSQKSDGGDHPVGFMSRKLSPAERRYSAIERELLGVVWSVGQFRPYLFGNFFEIRTDHMPLIWVNKLKETSARIVKWKETLAAYSFKVTHIKGTDNVVADCLSRNVGCIEAVPGTSRESEEPPFALRYLREWTENGPDLPQVESNNRPDSTLVEETDNSSLSSTEQRTEGNSQIERTNEIINGKRNQVILETGQGAGIRTHRHRYGPIGITTVVLNSSSTDDEIIDTLNQILKRGKKYHIYSQVPEYIQKITEYSEQGKLNEGVPLIICTKKVDTIEDVNEQRNIVEQYHVGKTNHRGSKETLIHISRRYYWLNMPRVINEVLNKCPVCGKAKYDRVPYRTPYVLTSTPSKPFETIEADIFHFEGEKYLTIIDRWTKLASAWPIVNKSANNVLEALLFFFSTFDCPKMIIFDRGREFYNKKVRETLNELGIEIHFTTTGHHRSHGQIERFHSTITEHLHLFKIGKHIVGREAMARAVLAYNSSIHTTTEFTPFELRNQGGDSEEIRRKINTEKEKRTRKHNETRAEELQGTLKIGDIVFRRNFYKRRKSDDRFAGPYRIIALLTRNRVKLSNIDEPNKKAEIVHRQEIKRKSHRFRNT